MKSTFWSPLLPDPSTTRPWVWSAARSKKPVFLPFAFLPGVILTAQVKPPRSLFVDFPMGNNFGEPFNSQQQSAILDRALQLIEEVETGGALEDWPESWPGPVEFFTGQSQKAYPTTRSTR